MHNDTGVVIGRIERSAALLSMHTRPSRSTRVNASQRARAYRIALAISPLPETRDSVVSSQVRRSANSFSLRSARTFSLISAGSPRIKSSTAYSAAIRCMASHA